MAGFSAGRVFGVLGNTWAVELGRAGIARRVALVAEPLKMEK